MWPEDYNLDPDEADFFDVDPDDWDEDWEEENTDILDAPAPEKDVSWRVQIEYANHTSQEIVSYQDYLTDRPEELYLALLDYFEPDIGDFEDED